MFCLWDGLTLQMSVCVYYYIIILLNPDIALILSKQYKSVLVISMTQVKNKKPSWSSKFWRYDSAWYIYKNRVLYGLIWRKWMI